MLDFEDKVSAVLNTCSPDTVFLAAVSGGADSMALLVSLCALRTSDKFHVLHVEHGLRPAQESMGDAEHVLNFCEKMGINCRVVHIPPGKIASYAKRRGTGIEAAARFFRRRLLLKEARRLDLQSKTLILTAHTKDDALELSLMRVLRGAGSAGLAAMPVQRGRFLRPLLSISRKDVLAYLRQKNIPWREDSTNKDEKFLRNKVRHRLIPLLNEFFPSWEKGIAGMAATQSLAGAFLKSEAAKRIKWEELPFGSKSEFFSLSTDAQNFFAQPQIIREESLFLAINRLFLTENTETRGSKSSLRTKHVPLCLCEKFNYCLCERNLGKSVNRKVIRRFCEGTLKAADFGQFRIKLQGGRVALHLKLDECSEYGFSLLIKESGLYNLNKISIKAAEQEDDGKEGFWAAMPLVFKPALKSDFLVNKGRKIHAHNLGKDIVSAVDRFGVAAFLGQQNLISRDIFPDTGSEKLCYISI